MLAASIVWSGRRSIIAALLLLELLPVPCRPIAWLLLLMPPSTGCRPIARLLAIALVAVPLSPCLLPVPHASWLAKVGTPCRRLLPISYTSRLATAGNPCRRLLPIPASP